MGRSRSQSLSSESSRSLTKEEIERERNRNEVLKRDRQWRVADDDDDDSSSASVAYDDKHTAGSRRLHGSREKYKNNSDDSSSDGRRRRSSSSRKKKSKKSKRRSRKRDRYSDDDDYSSVSSDNNSSFSEDSRRKRKKRKKRSEDKKEKKRSSKKKHKEKHKKSSTKASSSKKIQNEFGKYGIIKESDFRTKQRDFEVWLAEVKGIQAFTGPKWELMNYFKEYMEDYNTATMPHVKYYNYDKWEMEEYQRQKKNTAAIGGVISDEARHLEEMRNAREEKRKVEMNMVMGTMSKEKIAEMKRQQLLKHEMAQAFKTGDDEKRKKIQKRLEPEEEKRSAAHPWAR
mmetsp:Transcript_1566/g.2290  ORF Transcript_1566/g.2290 Transcript_1566/m.2290 type:complete len:343 (-) Transcript_1566:206-1234(-)|eukprot:CAMPEP_0116038416 /NCGR_PEP_ID=MMETSP0321-20121206/22779_1 /TAXON_ID=163516 /ORGANISM="Leptocylindrus danicus var. danicus, Strain B650" /LENGTH=342 /DNA_ID=CAMNT_0003517093 /DNA_START=44 /DNA_END=1072 /DNA_ORIENTATION=+